MKKFLGFLLLCVPGVVRAANIESYNHLASTFVNTAFTNRLITNTHPGSIFIGVVIGSVTTGGSLVIYDSSGTATNQIANISLSNVQDPRFEIKLSSGLTITTAGVTNGVTLLFKRRD